MFDGSAFSYVCFRTQERKSQPTLTYVRSTPGSRRRNRHVRGPLGARTGPHMPFDEESDATRAATLFRLAYGQRLRCLLKAHSGVGADAPEHDLVPVMAWRGFVPAHGSRDARYAAIARRSCSSRLATTWTINGLSRSGAVLEVIELPEHIAR